MYACLPDSFRWRLPPPPPPLPCIIPAETKELGDGALVDVSKLLRQL